MVRLNLGALVHASVGLHDTVVLDIGALDIGKFQVAYLKGALTLTRVEDGILLAGTLEASVKTECTRCLDPFFASIPIQLEDVVSLPNATLTEERPVRVLKSGWADLNPLLRQYIWLNLPMKPVCAPTCQGLCARCGGHIGRGECECADEPTIDPRWEKLRTLLNDDNQT